MYFQPKLQHHEKQGILEIRYSIGNIGSYGCTDSHQHYFVHGTWSHLYVNDIPLLGGLSVYFGKLKVCNIFSK